MEIQLRPALTRNEWHERRSGGIEFRRIDDATCLVVRYNDRESVMVRGAENLWNLIALANDTLPDGDPRKITREDVHLLHALAASIEVHDADLPRILPLVNALCEKINALVLHR